MTAAPKAPEIRIYVAFAPDDRRYTRDRNYGHVYGRPMILGSSEYEPGRALFSPNSYEIEPRPGYRWRTLDGLQASGQFDDDSGRVYGQEIEYDRRPTTNLREAEEMVVWLRKIDKGMRAVQQQFGYPRDFPAFLAHFAAVLVPKAVQPFWRSLTAEERNIEGTGYRAMDAESVRWWLNEQMAEYRKNAGLPEVPAAT